MPGVTKAYINSVDFLDDIFVKQNAYLTKGDDVQRLFSIIAEKNMAFMETFHKDYSLTRKVLAAAFFK